MFKRVGAIGAMGAAIAVVAATALSGTASAKIMTAAGTVSCKSPVTIGVAYPETGPDAGIGAFQWNWAVDAATKWNNANAVKINLVQGDTQLDGNNPQSTQVAHAFASNSAMVAVTGPAGSQEMQDTASIWHSAGLAPISGSETRIELTRAQPGKTGGPRQTTPGYFFRTVPNDGQQGGDDAAYIHSVLKKKTVEVINDGEAYSTGLATQVASDLKADKVKVYTDSVTTSTTSFASTIAHIHSGVQLIYIPWQVASEAQNFYTQLHSSSKKSIILFGSDGDDDPTQFKGPGNYVSGFPYNPSSATVSAFAKAHGGDSESFGIPTYTSVLVNATAIKAECAAHKNSITRAEVRLEIPKVKLTSAQSLLGFSVAFLSKNSGKFQGPGDMGGKAGFGIYKIQSNGTYKHVG
jgi:ABC-type branched-subunit amino acid transport system substrate-binding protein